MAGAGPVDESDCDAIVGNSYGVKTGGRLAAGAVAGNEYTTCVNDVRNTHMEP